MTLDGAIDSYRNDLHERHYSAADMERKQNLLRRWLSYAVALHQPGLPSRLLKMTEIRLYGGRGVVGAAGTAERHAAVAEFLNWWRTADANVRHVALATLIDQYRREQLAGRADEARRRRAVDDFCRGLGLELALHSMAANTYRQALGWLRAQSIERAATYSATFFVYCGEQGWLSFQPPSRTVREPYQRVFDPFPRRARPLPGVVADADRGARGGSMQGRSHRHKQREILLPDALWSALGDYLEVRAAPGQDRLWITWNKNPVTVSGLNKIITRRVREAGIEKVISPHRLRATCTSLYVKKGVGKNCRCAAI